MTNYEKLNEYLIPTYEFFGLFKNKKHSNIKISNQDMQFIDNKKSDIIKELRKYVKIIENALLKSHINGLDMSYDEEDAIDILSDIPIEYFIDKNEEKTIEIPIIEFSIWDYVNKDQYEKINIRDPKIQSEFFNKIFKFMKGLEKRFSNEKYFKKFDITSDWDDGLIYIILIIN